MTIRGTCLALACLLMAGSASGFNLWSSFVDPDSPYPFFLDGKWGFLDRNGMVVVEPVYEDIGYFSEELAVACLAESSCGYIDTKGKVAIELNLWWVNPFSEGVAGVGRQDGTVFLLGKTGAPAAIQPPPGTVGANDLIFSEGISPFQAYGKAGFFKRTGEILISPRFSRCEPFQEGLAAFEAENSPRPTWGAVGIDGNIVIPPIYRIVGERSEGLVTVLSFDEKWGVVDYRGNIVIKPRFYAILSFKEGLAPAAVSHQRWGYIDRQGRWVLKPKFLTANRFSEGLAAVSPRVDVLTVIDRKGEELFSVEGVFDAGPWRNGMAMFMTRDGMCYIDRAGQVIWPKDPEQRRCRVRFHEKP